MLFNIISILTWNRYGSCFNAVTHIYHVFPGIINTYHPGQNILRKWVGGAGVEGLSQYMEGLKCCRRMPVKEFIHYMPSLQSCKFTKNELPETYFQGFQLAFKLLFIVLFLGIISWKSAITKNSNWEILPKNLVTFKR